MTGRPCAGSESRYLRQSTALYVPIPANRLRRDYRDYNEDV